ncbi:MAG: FliH/SctL family protein [Acidobacteriota bacterium]
MPLRLIKKEDPTTARIQVLSFVEDPMGAVDESALGAAWAGAGLPGGTIVAGRNAARASASDPAHIEKQAYENGFRQGEKAGLELAEKNVEAFRRRYSEAISEVEKLKAHLFARAEKDVVRLALEVAKKIVHREISADPEIIQTLVKVALSHVAVKSAVTIRLNPADHSYFLERRSGISGGDDEEKEVILVADKAIERGGCLIQTECGDVDARIEEEFREVERSFFENGDR